VSKNDQPSVISPEAVPFAAAVERSLHSGLCCCSCSCCCLFYRISRGLLPWAFAFAFLSVIPSGNLLLDRATKRAPSKTLSSPPSARKPPKPSSTLAIEFPETWHSYPTQPAKLEVDLNPPSPAHAGPSLLTAESPRYDFHKSNPKPVPLNTLVQKVPGGGPHPANETRAKYP
jgi:hypothetical protein